MAATVNYLIIVTVALVSTSMVILFPFICIMTWYGFIFHLTDGVLCWLFPIWLCIYCLQVIQRFMGGVYVCISLWASCASLVPVVYCDTNMSSALSLNSSGFPFSCGCSLMISPTMIAFVTCFHLSLPPLHVLCDIHYPIHCKIQFQSFSSRTHIFFHFTIHHYSTSFPVS